MLRLVAYAPDGVRRFAIHRNELLIGSQPGCDIYLPYTGVAQAHARLRYDGGELRIEDLGSRRGVTVSGKRVRDALLEVLDEVRLGSVTLLVEDAPAETWRPAPVAVAPPPPAPREPRIVPEVMLEHLSHISNWVLADLESRTPLETLVSAMLADFGGGGLFLFHGDLAGEPGSKFVSASDPAWYSAGEDLLEQLRRHVAAAAGRERAGDFAARMGEASCRAFYHAFEAVERTYLLLVALPRFSDGGWSPGPSLQALGDLLVLGLVHHVGWYEPIIPGRMAQKDLTLDPALVVGEAPAMRALVDQLRLAVDPEVTVLLRGEAGTGKELLARSLHLSSPRQQGPFVAATCAGASPTVVEADLFGAELPGKGSPMRRQGKLLLADGGTLLLEHVEKLPLALQDRLVRFLRSGEVEPAGSRGADRVDVRLVVTSTGPLEPFVARDVFRLDLAYRLSQFAIDVPPVRARREDLPLLIQSAINRCCHETGKRMQGITVKAMSALLAYDYPGNLIELDNIARQLVYLCPAGKPIDVNLLPEKVRLSTVQAAGRVDATSDLALDRLVADTERAAIREALRRTHGNKSQAARLLGLSRNGLAMKMERHGLQG
jgi:DNA-binding NtrC family response regulator/pSer/pThr/pTyr-binding forkhead associated (FHA) protein